MALRAVSSIEAEGVHSAQSGSFYLGRVWVRALATEAPLAFQHLSVLYSPSVSQLFRLSRDLYRMSMLVLAKHTARTGMLSAAWLRGGALRAACRLGRLRAACRRLRCKRPCVARASLFWEGYHAGFVSEISPFHFHM